jgi:small conductance mechanosensitive channel
LAAAVLAIIGLWLIKLLNRWIAASLSKKRIDPSIRSFLQSIIATALKILLLLGLMQILGIQMTIFAAIVAYFSVAAGLAFPARCRILPAAC